MGEMAEMMLDGTLCECCGSYIDDHGGEGIPRYCSEQCAKDRGAEGYQVGGASYINRANPKKTNCPRCMKRVKIVGLADHIRDAHPAPKGSAQG